MAFLNLSRGHIGLDVGTSAVRAAEVRGSARGATVTRFGQVLLPRGAVVDGEVQEPDLVSQALTTLWKRAGFGSKTVRIGVANRRVVVRQLEMPAMSREDLDGAIRFQAQEYIPIPLAEAVMDFEVLEEFAGPEGQPLQRVLVVAAERGMVQPLVDAVREAKLEPVVLELNAYPLIRALGGEDLLSSEVEAIIDVGGGVTNVVIHRAGRIMFTRILPSLGGDDFTQAIVDQLGLDWEEAEAVKHRASNAMGAGQPGPAPEPPPEDGAAPEEPAESVPDDGATEPLPPPVAPPEPTVPEVGDDLLGRASDVLSSVLQRFVTEVRGSIDFYATQAGSAGLGTVVLTGGGSLLGGLEDQLQATIRVPVERGRVFSRVPVGKVKLGADQISVAEPFLAVAVGLALGGLEG